MSILPYAVSARGTVWPSLVCENLAGFAGLWRLVDFDGVCENFVPLNEGLLGIQDGIGYIPLTQGQVALVTPADYPGLIRYKWCAIKSPHTFYALAKVNGHRTPMHRFVMNPRSTMVVDHINHNGLDNRRTNLRICTNAQNSRNSRPVRQKKVKYKGVTFVKTSKRFRASIRHKKKSKSIGYFDNEVAAAEAYDEKAKELFGEYAYLNFPET